MSEKRTGLWLIGAKGGVASTVIIGLLGLKKNLAPNVGLVTELEQFQELGLLGWDDIVIGGHDIRSVSLVDEVKALQSSSNILSDHLVNGCLAELEEVDKNIKPGVLINVGETIEKFADQSLRDVAETPREAIVRIQKDLKEFQEANDLGEVIVMNVASTEPPADQASIPETWSELEPMLENNDCPLAASSIYAIAALDLGFPHLNFTPSLGTSPSAIGELAELRGTCHMGHDGKTGETLLKSALAPMFANRNLNIMSWVGHNIFGNMDGKVLDDPANKKTKVTSKDRLLGQILGYNPQTHISIEYIESLGDWKTAWDHIHFQGFLGTPMVMQFTWQGCDSILAAPLAIDLVRLTAKAKSNGETGLLTWLASFFKSPHGIGENNFQRQFDLLLEWVDQQS